jgi:hypothetical protein
MTKKNDVTSLAWCSPHSGNYRCATPSLRIDSIRQILEDQNIQMAGAVGLAHTNTKPTDDNACGSTRVICWSIFTFPFQDRKRGCRS